MLNLKQPGCASLEFFLFRFYFIKNVSRMNWSLTSVMVFISDWQTSVIMSHYNSFGYTSNRCTFDMQSFYYFNTFPMISSSNKREHPRFLVFKWAFFEFVYGLITFYSRYKSSFAAYLSIPALISGLHKMPQTLDFKFSKLDCLKHFLLNLDVQGGVHIHWRESLISGEQ